jgi:hypothetical protein
MKILVQFPTFLRKSKFLSCIDKYDSMSSGNHDIFFNINCDYIDMSMNSSSTRLNIDNIIKKNKYRINYIHNSNKISAINANINVDFDVLLCASDDMIPVVNGWDNYIAENMSKYFPDLDGALHFNDGYAGNGLITLSILGKKLYEYFGYVYHPDYKSLYCDNEFTEMVYSIKRVQYVNDIIIKHEHYSRENNINSGDYDAAAEKTLVFAGRDGVVYTKRKELGFPRHKITND